MGHADISFPMKGWRGMVDWARNSEDRVTIPKNILSTGKPGESCDAPFTHLHPNPIPLRYKIQKYQDAAVTVAVAVPREEW